MLLRENQQRFRQVGQPFISRKQGRFLVSSGCEDVCASFAQAMDWRVRPIENLGLQHIGLKHATIISLR